MAGKYEHVIKVDLKPTSTVEEAQGRGITSIKYQLTLAAAKELGLLGEYYNSLKEKHDQLQYYTYGCDGAGLSLQNHVQLISPTSQDAYIKSKTEDDGVISVDKDEHIAFLTLFALRRSAEHILNMVRQESIEYWHHMALDCFHYAMVIFAKHPQVAAITLDELIHQWATLLPRMTGTISGNIKCSCIRRIGRIILEAFQKYSLLQLPFSPASEAHEVTNTGAHFLAYHGLIAEGITVDELADNKKKWISFVGDHGCHVSREWLLSQEEGTRGTIALILRSCSEHILTKLNHFLPELCFLRLLDLSYTPLKSLPSSIGCLQNLRLLSFRGCHNLKTLFISSTTCATDSTENTSSPLSTLYQLEILDMNGVPFSCITQDVAKQKTNLIYLDMSYSEITAFPPKFFEDMSNLEELILVNCSNLVELPPSMAALSSLMTLEITGTQIKYFPWKIFEEMQKLQSLKLIDNNNLISLCRPISRVHAIKFEGHPNLKSFSLIGAPRIQRLSLHGCRKLESVEFKYLGAMEELDLSVTAIKELPADVTNGTQLRRLLLLGVPCLRRFPWHMLERLPEVFYLDQCIEGNANHSGQVTQLCVSDPRFFHSFGKSCVDSVRAGRFFQSFYVRVAPCSTNNMRLHHEEEMVDNKLQELLQYQLTYMDVHISCYAEDIAIVSPIIVPLRRSGRHVEITGMQQPLDGVYCLYYLLDVTKSISVTCDSSMEVFSDCSDFHDLEECVVAYQLLPKLQRVRLQELPLLQQFNHNDTTITTPMWKELHIRGCWSLRRLPRLQDQLKTVKVNGERSWWSKLQWGSPSHRDGYEPKLPPKFASLDERAGVTSYLR
ncbi:unnamed protein product [Alopecurus aequalis]